MVSDYLELITRSAEAREILNAIHPGNDKLEELFVQARCKTAKESFMLACAYATEFGESYFHIAVRDVGPFKTSLTTKAFGHRPEFSQRNHPDASQNMDYILTYAVRGMLESRLENPAHLVAGHHKYDSWSELRPDEIEGVKVHCVEAIYPSGAYQKTIEYNGSSARQSLLFRITAEDLVSRR